jgi:hypothetical protein
VTIHRENSTRNYFKYNENSGDFNEKKRRGKGNIFKTRVENESYTMYVVTSVKLGSLKYILLRR